MGYLTGSATRGGYSVGDTITYFTGNSRSVIWLLDNKVNDAILTLRISVLKSSCQLFINNCFVKSEYLTASGCIIQSHIKNNEFQIVVSPREDDPNSYEFICISGAMKVHSYMSFPYLSPLRKYLYVSIYYDSKNMQYEFQVIEYKWSIRMLIKSIDDIKMLDRSLHSIYDYLSKPLPALPRLKLAQSTTSIDVDGTIVASDLQTYFDSILALDGSAYCPDLLEFFELPVSIHAFHYPNPRGECSPDSALFASFIC